MVMVGFLDEHGPEKQENCRIVFVGHEKSRMTCDVFHGAKLKNLYLL